MFIAAIVIYFKPDWEIVDPICTFVFSLLVLGTTVSILRNTLAVIMEAAPPGISYSSVRNTLLTVPGIQAVHNLRCTVGTKIHSSNLKLDFRIWSLTTDKTAMSAHLVLEANNDAEKVLRAATLSIRSGVIY